MNRIFPVALLIIMIGFSGIADAKFKTPRITALEGQSKQQKLKDTQESEALAIKRTGVDPELLQMQMRTLESMQGRYSMPPSLPGKSGGRFSSTLPPSKQGQADENKAKIKKLEERHAVYLKAFSAEMEARGYKVK